jgi:hypothetical protein
MKIVCQYALASLQLFDLLCLSPAKLAGNLQHNSGNDEMLGMASSLLYQDTLLRRRSGGGALGQHAARVYMVGRHDS